MTEPYRDRKCSFRFLLVDGNWGKVITQDRRRRVRFITGCVDVFCGDYPLEIAKQMGCSVIIRQKETA